MIQVAAGHYLCHEPSHGPDDCTHNKYTSMGSSTSKNAELGKAIGMTHTSKHVTCRYEISADKQNDGNNDRTSPTSSSKKMTHLEQYQGRMCIKLMSCP